MSAPNFGDEFAEYGCPDDYEDDGTNGYLSRSMRAADRIARRMEEETPLAPPAAPREESEHHDACRCDFCIASPRVPELGRLRR